MADFFSNQLDFIFFLYGLGFILLAINILYLSGKAATIFPWQLLGWFGLTHGLNEWFDMFSFSIGESQAFTAVRLAMLGISFLLLLEFGRSSLHSLEKPTPGPIIHLIALSLALLGLFFGQVGLNSSLRYFIGFPASLLASYIFLQIRERESPKGKSLVIASALMGISAISAGLTVPFESFFPATYLNYRTFLTTFGFPVQILRGFVAIGLAYAMWHHFVSQWALSQKEQPHPEARTLEWRYIFTLTILLTLGWVGTELIGRMTAAEEGGYLQNLTVLAAATLDPLKMASLSATRQDLDNPEYQGLCAHLQNLQKTSLHSRWYYTTCMKQGSITFLLDSNPRDSPDFSAPGDRYDDAPPALHKVFQTGEALFSRPYKDKWGEFVSGFAPIRAPLTNTLVGVLGLDFDMSYWRRVISFHRLAPILLTLFLSLLLTGFFLSHQNLQESAFQIASSEKRYRRMFEENGAVTLLIDPETGGIVDGNQAAGNFYHLSREELMSRNIIEMASDPSSSPGAAAPDSEERLITLQLLHEAKQGERKSFSISQHLAKEEIRYVEIFCMPLDFGGQMILYSILHDITDHLEYEEVMRKYQTVVEKSPAMIVITDPLGNIEFVNPRFIELCGYTFEEVKGKNPRILQFGDRPPGFYESLWTTIKSGKEWRGEFHNRKKNGDSYWELASITGITDSSGKITHFLAVKEDITPWKENVRKLEEAKNLAEAATMAQEQFLAGISHEIRTPMNGLVGMIALLLETPLSEKQRHFAQVAQYSAKQLLSLITDVLDFSKIKSGKLETEEIEFDLLTTIEEPINLLALKAQEKGLEVIFCPDPLLPRRVVGDPSKVGQVLLNLLSNAIKFTEQGEVVLRVTLEETPAPPQNGGNGQPASAALTVRFTIADTGIGIPAEKSPLLFHPFSQVDPSTTRKYGGTGLGLAISRRLVELMGGGIGMESRDPRGSAFSFTIPFKRSATHESLIPFTTPEISGKRILIVDDNQTNKAWLKQILEFWKAQGTDVNDASAALQAMQDAETEGQPFDAILLNLQLCADCGLDLARHIKENEHRKNLPLVLMSSLHATFSTSAFKEGFFSGCLQKPIRPRELYDCLNAVLSGQSSFHQVSGSSSHDQQVTQPQPKWPPLHLLVVEDNIINQEVILNILNNLGFHSEVVASGKEAIQLLSAHTFDLVLMDIQMPDMDGFAATRIIRDPTSPVQNHDIPIIALTAHALAEYQERCLQAGMNGYLSKPINLGRLKNMLRQVLNLRQFQAEPETPEMPPSQSYFDGSELILRMNNNAKLVEKVIHSFFQNAPRQVSELQQAIAGGDLALIRRRAHVLKGSAANVSASVFRDIMTKIEQAAENNDAEAVARFAGGIDNVFDGVLDAMTTYLAEYPKE